MNATTTRNNFNRFTEDLLVKRTQELRKDIENEFSYAMRPHQLRPHSPATRPIAPPDISI